MTLADPSESSRRLFKDAAEKFRSSLNPKEKALFKEFSTSSEMLKDLYEKCKGVQNKSKTSRLCQKIEKFSTAWEPFFEITSLFVSSHPEFAGIIWGAIRLVFLLGTNYTMHLEKLVTMLQQIGDVLPAYEEFFNIFLNRRASQEKETGVAPALELRHHRLYKALSFVYVDIIQFCQEACRIFGSKRGGSRYTPSIIADVFWKPFDSRFSALLSRLRSHREVFENEVQLEESKWLEFQNSKRARRSDLNVLALHQIQSQVEELQKSNADTDLMLSNRLETIERVFHDMSSNAQNNKTDEMKENEALATKVAEIKRWANAPEYMREYEKARRVRLPDTGDYLIESALYQKWKGNDGPSTEFGPPMAIPALPQMLVIKGKPGFGKTVASSLIIEDLQSSSRPVLFYHFSSEKRDSISPYDAFRAIFVQLIHRFGSNKELVDQISVLMSSESYGQTTSSDEEVLAAVSLLLETAPHVSIVFDGIDECDDASHFLDLLCSISSKTPLKAVLLCRPSVEIPHHCPYFSMHLDKSLNLADIKTFVRPHLESLYHRRFLARDLDLDQVIDIISERAEGMFLWAWLMTQYLNCRALSPKERSDAIFLPSVVEGLDDVYEKILLALSRGCQREKEKVHKIFEILSVSIRPLHISELGFAVAVQPGNVTEESSMIVGFEESLPVLCSCLVEVQNDKTVQFVHSSFRDFLMEQSTRERNFFAVNELHANIALSAICLSYIMHDLPSSSISPKEGNTSTSIPTYFPFARYSTHWPEHASKGFGRTESRNYNTENTEDVHEMFYSMLMKFLNRPLSVTVWIESSWLFHAKPSLTHLVATCTAERPPGESVIHTANIAMTMLREFAVQLEQLNTEWSHLLKMDPKAIWGSSITAFSKSSFWYQTKDTNVSSILPSEAAGVYRNGDFHRPILLRSQVSSSGEKVGVAMIVPPRSYLIALDALSGIKNSNHHFQQRTMPQLEKEKVIAICSSGWRARLQMRNISDEALLMDCNLGIPEQQIAQMLRQSFASRTLHRLSIPVFFSDDLRHVVILQSILAIREVPSEQTGHTCLECRLQSLDQQDSGSTFNEGKDQDDINCTFSPTGSAFALSVATSRSRTMPTQLIKVWSNAAADQDWPKFEYKGQVRSSGLSSEQVEENPLFAFHPTLPLIVYSEWQSIALWRFNEERPKRLRMLQKAIASLKFGHDGAYIEHTSVSGEYILPEYYPLPEAEFSISRSESEPERASVHLLEDYQITLTRDSTALDPHLQGSGELASTNSNTSMQSTNVQIEQDGALLSGTTLIGHIPRLNQRDQTSISLVPHTEDDEFVRMVWNKDSQESYSVFDYQSEYLPSIIYRNKRTIPQLEDSPEQTKKRRLNLSDQEIRPLSSLAEPIESPDRPLDPLDPLCSRCDFGPNVPDEPLESYPLWPIFLRYLMMVIPKTLNFIALFKPLGKFLC